VPGDVTPWPRPPENGLGRHNSASCPCRGSSSEIGSAGVPRQPKVRGAAAITFGSVTALFQEVDPDRQKDNVDGCGNANVACARVSALTNRAGAPPDLFSALLLRTVWHAADLVAGAFRD
jgi:hypothetical protein